MSGIHIALLSANGGATFRLDSGTYTDFAISPSSAQTTLTVNSNGSLAITGINSGTLASYNWITPTAGSTSYFVRLTVNSGGFGGSATGSWIAVGQSWNVFRGSLGTTSANGTLAIATDSGGTNIVASANITLVAEVDI